ncbi:MAG: type II toxin-antitoxin system VapC family toxin [Armatimonadota bacterium]
MKSTSDELKGISKLGLDTSPIIYFVESHPVYDARVTPVFQMIENGNMAAVTSVISLIEVLTQPLRLNNDELCLQYHDLLLNAEHLELVSIDPVIGHKAALLRAEYGIRTPDALQLATAIEAGCEAFLTNDFGLKNVNGIRVILLDEIEP